MTTSRTPDTMPEATELEADARLEARRLQLSALMDGEPSALAGALSAWRQQPQARADWHAYHLAGDVLRSEDLAQSAAHDADFLARLRSRLDKEPVLMAPSLPAGRAPAVRRPTWTSGVAVAASVAALATVLWLGRAALPGSGDAAPGLATVGAPAADGALTLVQASADAGVVLRDPRLDEFLRMHQMARGGMPVSLPGSSLRQADYRVQGAAGQ